MSLCPHGQAGTNCPACIGRANRPDKPTTPNMVAVEVLDDGSCAPIGDARAQLWARVYGDVRLHGGRGTTEAARKYAIVAANDAVADFDEHYLRGQR